MAKKIKYGIKPEDEIIYRKCEQLKEYENWAHILERTPSDNITDPHNSCVVFGVDKMDISNASVVGMKGEDHVLIIGGSGSGKSSAIIKPTLITWKGAACITDIKGELSDFYITQYKRGIVNRKPIVFDPKNPDSPSYDPYYTMIHGDPKDLVSNAKTIVNSIFPSQYNHGDLFWIESVRSFFLASVLYLYGLGHSFNETIRIILTSENNNSEKNLINRIKNSTNEFAKAELGMFVDMPRETIALIDRELRNGLEKFWNPVIQNAFRGERDCKKASWCENESCIGCTKLKSETCFSWDNLESSIIFLKIPENKINQMSGMINLMYTQLLEHLEQRPDNYTADGRKNVPTLIIMDEFARFGKLDGIKDAVSTLRSKSVCVCLVVQSIAQLDSIYGECERRIIMDNCRYKAILGSNDPDTQLLLSRLIGTALKRNYSFSESLDVDMEVTGTSKEHSVIREVIVQPHTLALMNDVILITPNGNCRIDKIRLYSDEPNPLDSIMPNKEHSDQDYVLVNGVKKPGRVFICQ